MKIDKWDGAAVKNSLDDAAKKVINPLIIISITMINTCLSLLQNVVL